MFKATTIHDGIETVQHKWLATKVTEAEVLRWFDKHYAHCDRLIAPDGRILASHTI